MSATLVSEELDRIVEVFTLAANDRPAPLPAVEPRKPVEAAPPRPAVKNLQDKVRQAAKTYPSGNAAEDLEWAEF